LSFNAPPEKAGDTPVTTVDITPEDRRNLIGAGFTVEESNQISNDVNQFGIDAVLEGVDNEQQKNAIEKVYGVEEKVSRSQIESLVTQKVAMEGLEATYTEDKLIEIEKVTNEQIIALANKIFKEGKMRVAVIGDVKREEIEF